MRAARAAAMIRRVRARVAIAATLSSLAAGALIATAGHAGALDAPKGPAKEFGADQGKPGKDGGRKGDRAYPWERRVKAARRFARRRAGVVSFAIVERRGRIHGFRRGARYSSASLVKAMLMVAYLRRGSVRERRLHGFDKALLGPMIRVSDNGAANSVMARVGTGGLNRLAKRAGMRRFIPHPVWGGSQVTARDQARFFFRIRSLIPRRHRDYALGLLRRIAPGQRWGIPQGAPGGLIVHFKGGWYPGSGGWRVHQGALLRNRNRKLGLAVLTEGGAGFAYGQATIRGVTSRLLKGYPSSAKR